MDTAAVDRRELRYIELRTLVPSLVFVASIGVSFFSIWATQCLWLLTFLTRPAMLRILRRSSA